MKIPKIIHYCWFGNNKKSRLIRKCIRSWKKYCPDYQIIEWNERNFDINSIPFCAEAYAAKQWAFVTDYVRLKVLHEHGGFYMDTDVELLRSLDTFRNYSCIMGFQHENYVATGLVVGAHPQNDFIKENAKIYENISFENHSDSRKLIICSEYTTNLLKQKGLVVPGTNQIQQVGDVTVFPPEYFCPYDHRTGIMHKTENTYAIHHFASSWWDKKRRKAYNKRKRAATIYHIVHLPNRALTFILGKTNYEKLKSKIKK